MTKKGRVTLRDKIPSGVPHDEFKEKYIRELGLDLRAVAVFGNGRNDAKWLEAVKDAGGLAIAVDVGEGCAIQAMNSATIFVSGIANALDLLLDTKRVIGTLRTE
jgi:soluble P-type ATPase